MSVDMFDRGSRTGAAVAASGCDAVSNDSRGPRSEVSLREMRRQNHLDSVGGEAWSIHSSFGSLCRVKIPRTAIQRQFHIHIGHCDGCGKRIQPRHELQTNDALGAAAPQLGPNLQAAMAILNKEIGLPHRRIERVLSVLFELNIARSKSVRSICELRRKHRQRLRKSKRKFVSRRSSKLMRQAGIMLAI